MLCKVAQVFARGVGLDTLSFALPFSDEETNYMLTKCMHTLQLFDPCYISSADYSCRIVSLSNKAVEHYLLYPVHPIINHTDMHSNYI